jgi:hypothetical protein
LTACGVEEVYKPSIGTGFVLHLSVSSYQTDWHHFREKLIIKYSLRLSANVEHFEPVLSLYFTPTFFLFVSLSLRVFDARSCLCRFIISALCKETAAARCTDTRAVRQVSSHSECLENRSRGLDVYFQPVRGDLTVHL